MTIDLKPYALQAFQKFCYYESVALGWHKNNKTGLPFTEEEKEERFPMRISLCHSEISEALNAHRTDAMDDHLPHRLGAEVELADAIIRIFDLGETMGYDLATAMYEKLEYNRQRKDHKVENRNKKGGKKY
jgi:hypothetical protein